MESCAFTELADEFRMTPGFTEQSDGAMDIIPSRAVEVLIQIHRKLFSVCCSSLFFCN